MQTWTSLVAKADYPSNRAFMPGAKTIFRAQLRTLPRPPDMFVGRHCATGIDWLPAIRATNGFGTCTAT